MVETRVCQYHGLQNYRKSGASFRCIKCMSEAVSKRRKKLKILAVEYLGGCCQLCGYNKSLTALEFHHKDPTQKDFGISESGSTRSFEKIKLELDKCILVCANCHREIHEGITTLAA